MKSQKEEGPWKNENSANINWQEFTDRMKANGNFVLSRCAQPVTFSIIAITIPSRASLLSLLGVCDDG